MTIEVFEGTPAALADRLTTILGGAVTINWVLNPAKGIYIIAYT